MNPSTKRLLYSILIAQSALLTAYDNVHFYRATNFIYQPRLERNLLTTIDLYALSGSTNQGRNSWDQPVPLFDTWGINNMHELGVGVPGKDLTNPLDLIITQLSLIPSRCTDKTVCNCKEGAQFATYSIAGKFTLQEAIINFVQNWKHGLFLEIYAPIRNLKVSKTCICDNSPIDSICPNASNPTWLAFNSNFGNILEHYNLSDENVSSSGFGDTTILLGVTHSFQNTQELDFIDATARLGVLLPTGCKQNQNQIFSLPTGYDGHLGAVFVGELAVGFFNWLDIGGFFNAIVFGNKTECIRMKTAPAQSGIIKLAKGEAKINKGTILAAGAYLKADHFIRGFSLLFGYSYGHKNNDTLCPVNIDLFPAAYANSDAQYASYTIHTVNFMAEYDFTKEGAQFGPRISVFYNLPVGGHRYFNTATISGNLGLDICWDL
jgi:hypothetical protein